MAETVADVVIATLKASGVRRVYGIPGDSLNGFTDALRWAGGIAWQHARHEEAAAFATAAEAAVTGELAVCAASCGPGNLHLITLYETRTILSGNGEELVELAKTNLRQVEAE
jgi:pyruvate dehydrogenase (quinone)